MATIRAIRPFLGTLRIVWMAERDLDFIDMNVPGHFTFEAHGLGGFQFGLVQGDIDRRADDGLAFRAERRQAAATARSRK